MSARPMTAVFVAAAFAAAVPCATFAHGATDKTMEKPMMAHPMPAPEMANLKYMEGNWSCSGQGAMEPGGATMKMDSSVSAKPGLGGFWQMGTVKGAAMAGMPAMEGMFHTTWDSATKQYVMLWVDNMGGWSQSRSTGWTGDTLVFTGEGQMGEHKVGMRDTFMRKGADTMTHVGEMQANGQWVKMMDETCRKSAH